MTFTVGVIVGLVFGFALCTAFYMSLTKAAVKAGKERDEKFHAIQEQNRDAFERIAEAIEEVAGRT